MSVCRGCNTTNPDFAAVCSFCKAPLDKAPVRQPTLPEGAMGVSPRRGTIDESVSPGGAAPYYSPTGPRPAIQPAQPGAGAAHPGNAPARRVTVFDAGPGSSGGAQQAAGTPAVQPKAPSASTARKIVGVLVTYSWSDQGQIFPVLEGRNRIGSDPAQCDIAIPQDDTLSSINSHIVFRKSFTIGDEVSMGGTDVDGEPVETAFVPLRNYARIRTGSTHWTFIAVQPPAGEAATEGK